MNSYSYICSCFPFGPLADYELLLFMGQDEWVLLSFSCLVFYMHSHFVMSYTPLLPSHQTFCVEIIIYFSSPWTFFGYIISKPFFWVFLLSQPLKLDCKIDAPIYTWGLLNVSISVGTKLFSIYFMLARNTSVHVYTCWY